MLSSFLGVKAQTSALVSTSGCRVDAACSRFDEAVGACRLSHCGKGHEDGYRTGCQSLERCKCGLQVKPNTSMNLPSSLRAQQAETTQESQIDSQVGHTLRHAASKFAASSQVLLRKVSRGRQKGGARHQRRLRHEDGAKRQLRRYPSVCRGGCQGARWHQDHRRLRMCKKRP